MTKSDLKKLIEHGQAPALEIHAFEGIIYLVKIIKDVGETMLKKEDCTNQTFKSSTQAGIAFGVGGKEAISALGDEVIGHDPCLGGSCAAGRPWTLRLLASLVFNWFLRSHSSAYSGVLFRGYAVTNRKTEIIRLQLYLNA